MTFSFALGSYERCVRQNKSLIADRSPCSTTSSRTCSSISSCAFSNTVGFRNTTFPMRLSILFLMTNLPAAATLSDTIELVSAPLTKVIVVRNFNISFALLFK